MNRRTTREAYTLIELLSVMGLIALLVGILVPATQSARESARRVSCLSKLRQLGLGLSNFESARTHYPSSWLASTPIYNGRTSGWSSHAQLLPFIEHQDLYDEIDFRKQYAQVSLPGGEPIGTERIAELICPSEPGDRTCVVNDKPCHYPLNYGANVGVWFVYDPILNRGGEGAFYPNSRLRSKAFEDGKSRTVAFAEVKAWTPYFRNAARFQPQLPMPDSVSSMGGQFRPTTGHTRWVDGRAQSTGVTATFTPNTFVPYEFEGMVYDIDWNNQCEGLSPDVSTYSAVTARSHHGGGVNVVRMDGSSSLVRDLVDVSVWHAMFTRRSGDGVANATR